MLAHRRLAAGGAAKVMAAGRAAIGRLQAEQQRSWLQAEQQRVVAIGRAAKVGYRQSSHSRFVRFDVLSEEVERYRDLGRVNYYL